MTKAHTPFLLAIFVLSLAMSAYSTQFLDNRIGGGGAFSFNEDFTGPRITSLAGTGVSYPTFDLFSVLLSPAATRSTGHKHHFAASVQSGTLETDQAMLAWSFPLSLALMQVTYSGHSQEAIAGQDENGNPTGVEYFPYDQSIALSAQVPTTHFRIGLTLKHLMDHLSNDVGDQNAMAWAMDWGIQLRNPSPRWGLGLAVLNLGNQFRSYRSDAAYQADGQTALNYLPLNTTIQLGGHWNMTFPRGMTWLLDLKLERYSPMSLHTAFIYTPLRWVELRAGLQRTIPELQYTFDMFFPDAQPASGHWNRLNGGFSLLWERWTMDYAIVFLSEYQGFRHQIGLRTYL